MSEVLEISTPPPLATAVVALGGDESPLALHDRGTAPDLVELELPVGRAYACVGRLVAAGVALRRDVSIERIEDLQTALDTVLQSAISGDRIRLVLWNSSDGLHVEVGPFTSDLHWRGIDGVLSELVDELVIRVSGADVWVLLRVAS